VEGFFALISERQIKRSVHVSVKDLEQSIDHYLSVYNQAPKPFIWTQSADQILGSISRLTSSLNISTN
jgi:hypothetical protein